MHHKVNLEENYERANPNHEGGNRKGPKMVKKDKRLKSPNYNIWRVESARKSTHYITKIILCLNSISQSRVQPKGKYSLNKNWCHQESNYSESFEPNHLAYLS